MSFFKNVLKKNILVVGDVFLDEYLIGRAGRISPEAPVPIINISKTYSVLGGAGNTAANITSLSASCNLIGVAGKDPVAIELKQLCKKEKISFSAILKTGSSIKKTRVVAQNQQLLRIDHEKTAPPDDSHNKKTFERIKQKLNASDVVVLSDYAKGFFNKDLCQKIIKECKKAKKAVIIDPRPQHAAFYRGCDFITPNWKEACVLSGTATQPMQKKLIREVALKIAVLFKSSVVITLGEWGLYYLSKDNKKSFFLPTLAKEVFDVSGAGDTFVAAFSLACACKFPIKDALVLANQAAGVVVAKPGTAKVVLQDLESEADSEVIVDRNSLKLLVEKLREGGSSIVTINGSFDLLHSGHLHILKEAKRQGDILIVGLNSDVSIKKYKEKNRPIVPQGYRAEALVSLKCVDYVHIFSERDPRAFLREVRPDVHVNGSEYGANCIEAKTVKRFGGKLYIVKKIKGLSTSSLIKKINRLI